MATSLNVSPARKRQRLSSPPLFEDEYDDAALAVFDEIMSSQQPSQPLKQNTSFPKVNLKRPIDWDAPQQSSPPETTSFKSAAALSLQDDPDNVFADRTTFSTAKSTFSSGFSSASALAQMQDDDDEPTSSPENPPEVDVDAWFTNTEIPPAGFMTAGFTSGKNKPIVVSEAALKSAKSLLTEWEKDLEEGPQPVPPSSTSGFTSATKMASKMETSKPTPLVGSSKINSASGASSSFTGFSTPVLPKKQFNTPLVRSGVKPFTPPTMKPLPSPLSVSRTGSPLNPNRPSSSTGFASAYSIQSPHPLSATPTTLSNTQMPTLHSAKRPSTTPFKTPFKAPMPSTAPRTTPARFVTPFKPGMKPGEPGRSKLSDSTPMKPLNLQARVTATQAPPSPNWFTKPRPPPKQYFDMTPCEGRKTLASSGLEPQRYDQDEFAEMGIDIATLKQITPSTAMYFSFHTASRNPTESGHVNLGPDEALEQLLSKGCVLAKKPWVDNHWSLILWKLAGMVALDPRSESNPATKRWCWDEVMRQLLYRYEKELNSGYRPALRRISTQDAPSEFPMTLCVSDVIWKDREIGDTGHSERVMELEVTDGWYRLRAEVDKPLMKAISRDVLRVGRKLGVAGARLITEKKDPLDILEAYNSVKLSLNGNSSHLMPWHTKLGFMSGPCISTLHHLSPDGGVVAAIDFVVLKVYPIAYMEFKEAEDGTQRREGPRDQAEEDKENRKWRMQREIVASDLRSKYETKYIRYQGLVERLERKAGDRFKPGDDDYPPDNLDSLYDDLEYPDSTARLMKSLSPSHSGWLARHVKKQLEKEQDRIGEEIERELDSTYPPRKVRSFCVLVVQDAKTIRKTSHRSAQLTVWDANTLSLEEGEKPGSFKVGQRFMVTHLVPTQSSAWMDRSPGSVVYLSTRKDSRWNKLRTDA